MTTSAADTAGHGITVGPTSEFRLFFRVRAGQEREIREAITALQNSPGYRPGDYELPIAVIHEARFVLFDDDTRLLFATSFDGTWDSYYEWQDWSYEWTVTRPGRYTLRARATDAAGNIQPDVPPWNRLGYGNNAVEVQYVDVR